MKSNPNFKHYPPGKPNILNPNTEQKSRYEHLQYIVPHQTPRVSIPDAQCTAYLPTLYHKKSTKCRNIYHTLSIWACVFLFLENLKLPQNPRNSMTTQDTLKSKEFHVQRGTHGIWATFEKKHPWDWYIYQQINHSCRYPPGNESISHLGKKENLLKKWFLMGYVSSQEGKHTKDGWYGIFWSKSWSDCLLHCHVMDGGFSFFRGGKF